MSSAKIAKSRLKHILALDRVCVRDRQPTRNDWLVFISYCYPTAWNVKQAEEYTGEC